MGRRDCVGVVRVRERVVYASSQPGGTEALTLASRALDAVLQDGETVLLRRRASLLQPLAQVVVGVALLAMLGLIVVAFGARPASNPWMWGIAGVVAVVVFVVPWPMLDWWSTRYVLTDRRVLTVRGIVVRGAVELALPAVRRVEELPNALGRFSSVGTILIGNPVGEPPVLWVNIPRAGEAKAAVMEAVHRYGRGHMDGEG